MQILRFLRVGHGCVMRSLPWASAFYRFQQAEWIQLVPTQLLTETGRTCWCMAHSRCPTKPGFQTRHRWHVCDSPARAPAEWTKKSSQTGLRNAAVACGSPLPCRCRCQGQILVPASSCCISEVTSMAQHLPPNPCLCLCLCLCLCHYWVLPAACFGHDLVYTQ